MISIFDVREMPYFGRAKSPASPIPAGRERGIAFLGIDAALKAANIAAPAFCQLRRANQSNGVAVHRSLDPSPFFQFAKSPGEHLTIGHCQGSDLAKLVGDAGNFALCSDNGGLIAIPLGGGVYEASCLLRPELPVELSVAAIEAALAYLLVRVAATEVIVWGPEHETGLLSIIQMAGLFDKNGRDATWGSAGRYLAISAQEWALRSVGAHAWGLWLRRLIDGVMAASPAAFAAESYDRMLGAAWLLMRAGNVKEGVNLFNNWAAATGCIPIAIVSHQPPVVRIHDAVVQFTGTEFEVLLC